MVNRLFLSFSFIALGATICLATETTVTVSATGAQAIPTTLWGQTFEDISYSGDGGLYAELLQNRAFQQVTPNSPAALAGWHSINGANISVVTDVDPVSVALPNRLRMTIPSGRFGPTGFGNEGYFGIKVNTASTYRASFFYKFPTASSFKGTATIGLQTSTGLSLGVVTTTLTGTQTKWIQVNLTFRPVQAAFNNNNYFFITVDGAAASGQTIDFAMLSLFPPTYLNRVNGMRLDLANALIETKPGFLRFPGGRNLEGQTRDTRWQWNATVGALVTRPGRVGTWGSVNTDGLGLLEFLQFCEDIAAKPVMAVWAGFSLDGASVDEQDLGAYINQAIDQINFAVGSTATVGGKLRSSLGHAAAFALTYVEVGNEDFFASDTYVTRWRDFVSVLSQNFPQLKFIATSSRDSPVLSPKPTHYDIHTYETPAWFIHNTQAYDSMVRDGTMFFEGEYGAVSTNDSDIFGTPANGRLVYPTVQSALAEAAFMTGIERNSDIVIGAAYAPLLNNVNNTRFTPNLISFDIDNVYRSTSFYVQKLFGTNRGSIYFPSTLPDPNGQVFWSVVRDTPTAQYVMKVVNSANTAENVTFILPVNVRIGTANVLTGPETASNTPANPNLVVPVSTTITLPAANKVFLYTAPPFSVSVVRMS